MSTSEHHAPGEAGGSAAPTPSRLRHRLRGDGRTAALLLAPSILVFAVWVVYPVLRTVWLGFFLQDPFGIESRWVGLEQYVDVITSSSFRNSLWVTLLFALFTVPASILLGLGLAALANQELRGIRIFRTIFASTIATSVAVASMLWLVLLEPSAGLFNRFLESIGAEPVDLLNDPDTALAAVAATSVWQNLGLVFVVSLAAMQSIPGELYEAAEVDGHGAWSRFRRVTVPLLGPQLLFLSIVLTIASFQSFAQVDLLTEGGPGESTNVVVYSIVDELAFDQGAAAAQSVALFVILAVLSWLQFRWLDRRVSHAD